MRLEVLFLVKNKMKLEKQLRKKETVYNFSKRKEQEGSLTNRQKRVLKNIDRYFKKKNYKNTVLHMAWIIYLMNLMK